MRNLRMFVFVVLRPAMGAVCGSQRVRHIAGFETENYSVCQSLSV